MGWEGRRGREGELRGEGRGREGGRELQLQSGQQYIIITSFSI